MSLILLRIKLQLLLNLLLVLHWVGHDFNLVEIIACLTILPTVRPDIHCRLDRFEFLKLGFGLES